MSSPIPVPLIRGRHARAKRIPLERKPPWLTVTAPGSPGYLQLKRLMRDLDLHTVCEEAMCPNIGECWNRGTATFMILGDTCTRACGYCNVIHGVPNSVDPREPERLAQAVVHLELDHVVITSVDRDDLDDGGASLFAASVRAVRTQRPKCGIEVLIPDFGGSHAALQTVLAAQPDILNHNIETVERLYPTARPGGRYDRALQLLDRVRKHPEAVPTKSGLMVGLGEELSEIRTVLADLRAVGCRIVTIGQYLRPSIANLPVARYYTPAEFSAIAGTARNLGFAHVEAGPLVRSSYHADEQTDAFRRTCASV